MFADSLVSLINLTKPSDSFLDNVRSVFYEWIMADSQAVLPLTEYVANNQGKMLRPSILLYAGNTCGEISEKHIQAAVVIEMIHTATLLHDDVIDNAQIRRTGKTVNKIWSNKDAILLGDFLLAKAFLLCSKIQDSFTAETLAAATEKICTGEITQNQLIGKSINEETYFEIIENKTASLFAASAAIGAHLSNANNETVNKFYQFGKNFGIAFQIQDDLSDIISSQEAEGKTVRLDVSSDKTTLPLIHYYQNCSSPKKISKINQKTLQETASIEYTIKEINKYCNLAKQIIE